MHCNEKLIVTFWWFHRDAREGDGASGSQCVEWGQSAASQSHSGCQGSVCTSGQCWDIGNHLCLRSILQCLFTAFKKFTGTWPKVW